MDTLRVDIENSLACDNRNGDVVERILAINLEHEEDRRADDRFTAWFERKTGIKTHV